MSKIFTTPVAKAVPFDNTTNSYVSQDVQDALEEVYNLANAPKGRLPVTFWGFSTFSNNYLYFAGQIKSNTSPFVSSKTALFNEIAVSGNMTSANSNSLFAIYRVPRSSIPSSGTITPSMGSVASVTNQGLTYDEADYPYAGTTRVTINLINNGPSLPLAFSENLNTRTVTVQLATNGGGTVTTTRTQLRDGFRANNTINQLWRITGTGGATVTPASFSCSGGSVGDEIAAIHLRANSSNYRDGYNVTLNAGDVLIGYCVTEDTGSISSHQVTGFVSY